MGQRKRTAELPPPSEFKYANVVECEENEDAHVVRPTVWPPRRQGNQAGDPSVPLQCTLCSGWVITYEGHATGQLPGVKVILPGAAA